MTKGRKQRVLVCGGRKFEDGELLTMTLDLYKPSMALLIQGGASGADNLANRWALDNGIVSVTFHAPWPGLGKAAGPIRNQTMLDVAKPDLVLAFPGGTGTRDLCKRAKGMGIDTREVLRPKSLVSS